MYGYYAITTFAKLAEKAGKTLTAASFNNAMETNKLAPDILGNPGFNVSKENRLSNQKARVTRVVNGKWVLVTDYLDPVITK